MLEKSKDINPVEMVKGRFKPSEAKEIVNTLFKEIINFYKLKQLRMWVKNHNSNDPYFNEAINCLKAQKQELLENINQAEQLNLLIEFKGGFTTQLVR